MPTYEYRCKSCQHQFDAVQSFTDAALSQCPECGGVLKKLFGSVGITFKGSGFYKTDSRSAASGASKSDGGDSPGDSAGDKVGAGKDVGPKSESNGSSGSTDDKAARSSESAERGRKTGKDTKADKDAKGHKGDRAGSAAGSKGSSRSGS